MVDEKKITIGDWGRSVLPSHLRDKKHDDWLWPFKYIPRWVNAFGGQGPVWGGEGEKPIPPAGKQGWHLYDKKTGWWRPYYAFTFKIFKWHLHFRVGFRWDDVDFYYNLVVPFTLKFVTKFG